MNRTEKKGGLWTIEGDFNRMIKDPSLRMLQPDEILPKTIELNANL